MISGERNFNNIQNKNCELDATLRCDFSWILFVGTNMLGFTEKEIGHFTFKKWSLLYEHFKIYYNFKISKQLFKEKEKEKEKTTDQISDEWIVN